jgi:hypothetical protein
LVCHAQYSEINQVWTCHTTLPHVVRQKPAMKSQSSGSTIAVVRLGRFLQSRLSIGTTDSIGLNFGKAGTGLLLH